METTYLVFLKKNTTGEEFVAPAKATTREEAMAKIAARYGTPQYTLQTCYGKKEMERIMADIDRWPGVASSVQPTTGTAVRSTTGKLPPLTRQPMQSALQLNAALQNQAPTGATVQQTAKPLPAMGPTSLAEAMALLRGGKSTQTQAAAPTPTGGKQRSSTLGASAASATSRGKKQPSSSLSMPSPAQGKSVIDVLRALRG